MKTFFTGNPKDEKPDEYVVFTFNNARIVVNPTDQERLAWEGAHIVVKNPDLSSVAGFAPQYWKVVSGHVVPLTYGERVVRSEHIESMGAINCFMPYIEQSTWVKTKAIAKVHGLKAILTILAAALGSGATIFLGHS
jgi:hypothetical protein